MASLCYFSANCNFDCKRELIHLDCEHSLPRNVRLSVCFSFLFLLLPSLSVRFQESASQLCVFLPGSICPVTLPECLIPTIFPCCSERRMSLFSEETFEGRNEAECDMSWF